MAPRMIPNRYLADYRSGGEEYVFETLRDTAPDDWVVLHSLDIAPSDARRRGEADFVVIVPGKGAAVLEVKSIASQDADRVWHFGPGVTSQRSPFVQADSAMRSILSFLSQEGVARRPFFCSGVVTPFGDVVTQARAAHTIEWNQWQAIGRSALQAQGLVKAIERLIDRERESEKRPPQDFDAGTAVNLLRPRFEFYVSPAARKARREEEIKRYTEEQFDALDDFETNGQLLTVGPAGCGKTLLALEAVRRAVENGQSVLLVCFNRLLGEWLQRQARPLGYLATATHLDSFMLGVAGLRPMSDNDRTFWAEDLPLTAAARFSQSQARFDVLVADEAQDLVTSARLLFLDECLEGGLNGGRWLFFGDFEGQNVQQRGSAEDARLAMEDAAGGRVLTRRLRRNCRNTQSVAHFAEEVGRLSGTNAYSSCLRPEVGEPPRLIQIGRNDDKRAALAVAIVGLLDEGFAKDEIVVLSAGTPEASSAASLSLEDDWRDILTPAADTRRGKVRFDTIRRFKGLEAPVVVLTDIADDTGAGIGVLRDLVYVGSTRAVDRLVVIAEAEASGHLRLAGVS